MRKNVFWVLHAAGINVGENRHAVDYGDYRDASGSLDLAAYIEDTARVFSNIEWLHRI